MTGAEVALRAAVTPRLTATTTLFANRLSNAIANVTIGPNLRERQNIDAIRSKGVETEIAWRRGEWEIDASLSLVSAKVVQSGVLDGLEPAQVPKLSLAMTAARTIGRSQFSLTVRHLSSAFEDDLNQDRLPPATTIDLVGRHRLNEKVELSVRGENLLDERIVTRNQGGSIDLGVPRTIWLSLSLKAAN
jgi:outer membrane receptor protein involved in Fe transport